MDLLIAPEGIEISFVRAGILSCVILLIAPEGIEIEIENSYQRDKLLLIAPEGIEISFC